MTDTYFITGATGTLGKRIVTLLLAHTDSSLVLLVHERGQNVDIDTFLKKVIGVNNETYVKRVRLIYGDITQSKFGLTDDAYTDLTKTITHIVHGAASTRFDLPLQDARSINCTGTEHMAELFRHLSSPVHFAFLSTAYVAGKNKGVILEEPLRDEAGFVNTYEQSKYEAEGCVLDLKEKASIYRLSTVIGDSSSGVVDHFTAPHQALRIMHLGLAAMVPGTPDYVVDLIPSDHASKAIVDLLLQEDSFGDIYHLTAGPDRSFTLKELLEESYRYLAEYDPEWAKKGYPPPPIVSQQTFNLFLNSAEDAGNVLVHKVLGAMRHFSHQLTYPKDFDRTNVDKQLPQYHADLPHISSYYPNVIKYCVSTKFGKLV